MDNKTLAEKIFKAAKTALASTRKSNKGLPLGSWSRKSQMVDFAVWDNDKWDKDGKRYTDSYTIKMNNKEMGSVKTRTDISEVFCELGKMFDQLKKTKGWSGLSVVEDTIEYNNGVSYWCTYKLKYIAKVCLADAPCKEYKALQNYLNKYALAGPNFGGYNKPLGNYELFSAAMGGKRGRLWDEYGERCFLDNKPNKCARILEELRKARGSKDTISVKRGEENYIDDFERKHSEYYEVECEGEKRKYIEITIKTPTGRVKYQEKIY